MLLPRFQYHEPSTLAEACRLLGLPEVAGARQVDTTFLHRRLKAGQRLTSQGEPFEALYIVAEGFFKTFVADETGNQLVLGFPLRGDLVGADGLCNHRHASYAVALTEAEVVVVPFRSIAHLGRSLDDFEQIIYRAISRELVTDHSLRSLVGTLGAEARVARFLANFADRCGRAGRPATRITLPMTRQELGSYLGLTLETVSRAFSALADAGLTAKEIDEVIEQHGGWPGAFVTDTDKTPNAKKKAAQGNVVPLRPKSGPVAQDYELEKLPDLKAAVPPIPPE